MGDLFNPDDPNRGLFIAVAISSRMCAPQNLFNIFHVLIQPIICLPGELDHYCLLHQVRGVDASLPGVARHSQIIDSISSARNASGIDRGPRFGHCAVIFRKRDCHKLKSRRVGSISMFSAIDIFLVDFSQNA